MSSCRKMRNDAALVMALFRPLCGMMPMPMTAADATTGVTVRRKACIRIHVVHLDAVLVLTIMYFKPAV